MEGQEDEDNSNKERWGQRGEIGWREIERRRGERRRESKIKPCVAGAGARVIVKPFGEAI